MASSLVHRVARVLSPGWLTGPIFTKELRVSSRRKRSYMLRLAYVALLTLFVGITWHNMAASASARMADYGQNLAYQSSRMAEVGKQVVSIIVWFQFLALQLVCAVMCSTAVSDEIYRRTLGVLLTTPINSFQIVMGKLLSRIFQLLVLVAVSLPLLAVVRIFGGVPWGYLVAALCITLTALIFTASVSILFSIFSRHAYVAILRTMGVGLVLFAVLPVLWGLMVLPGAFGRGWGNDSLMWFSVWGNPFFALSVETVMMISPFGRGAGGAPGMVPWLVHCGIMLAMSALVLMLCVRLVRRAALRQMIGSPSGVGPVARWQPTPAIPLTGGQAASGTQNACGTHPNSPSPWGEGRGEGMAAGAPLAGLASSQALEATPAIPVSGSIRDNWNAIRQMRESGAEWPPAATGAVRSAAAAAAIDRWEHARIRPVTGSPIIWKELRPPIRSQFRRLIGPVSTLVLLALFYMVASQHDLLRWAEAQVMWVSVCLLVGLVATGVVSATVITTEKEASSWPILLTTALPNWQITLGKAVGVIRRTIWVWAILFGNMIFIVAIGYAHPIALIFMPMVVFPAAFFLTAAGVSFSAAFRRTTAAVVANFALALTIWLIGPILLSMSTTHHYRDEGLAEFTWDANPMAQAAVVMEGAGGPDNARQPASTLSFHWPTDDGRLASDALSRLFVYGLCYCLAGLAMLAVTNRKLRKNVF